MSNDGSTRLRSLLERLCQGDDTARKALVGHAYEQLRVLVRKIFHQDFPRLEGIHETGSILNETALRLLKALQEVHPATPRGFFAFASVQIRRVLIDMARRQDCRASVFDPAAEESASEPVDPHWQPTELAIWTEFHERVEQLPEGEREVVDLYFYQGFTQVETAELLGVHERAVSRLWHQAVGRLSANLPGWDGSV